MGKRSRKLQKAIDESNARKKRRKEELFAFNERRRRRTTAEQALDEEIASTWVFIEHIPAENESIQEWEVVSIGSSGDEVRTWTEDTEELSDDIHDRQGAIAAELLVRMSQRKGQMSREHFMSLLTHLIRCTAQSLSQKDPSRLVPQTACVLIPVKPYNRQLQLSLQRMAALKGDMTTEEFTDYLKRLIDPTFQETSTLHKLPLEVRRMIYYHALVRNEPTYDIRNIAAKSDSGKYIALLRTSRQISAEAAEVLYGENKFDFSGTRGWSGHNTGGDCGWIYLESFLYTIGQQNRQRLRTIMFNPPDWSGLLKDDNESAGNTRDQIKKQALLAVPTIRRDILLGSFMSSCAILAKLPNLLRIFVVLDVGHYLQFWIDEEPNDEQRTRKRYGTRLQKRFAAENKVWKDLVRTSSALQSNLTVSLVIAGEEATIPNASMASLKLKVKDLGIYCRL